MNINNLLASIVGFGTTQEFVPSTNPSSGVRSFKTPTSTKSRAIDQSQWLGSKKNTVGMECV